MAGIGERERESLGIGSDADDSSRKSTRRGEYDSKTVVPKTSPNKHATPSKQFDKQSPASISAKMPLRELLHYRTPQLDPKEDDMTLGSPPKENVTDEHTPPEPATPSSPGLAEALHWDFASCAETLAEDEFPSLAACTHRADICRGCFSALISERLNTQAWDQLSCPSLECNTRLNQDDLQPHVGADVFER